MDGIMTQFTLDDIKRYYEEELMTAKGAIAFWIRIYLEPGVQVEIEPQMLQEVFLKKGKPMSRSTLDNVFYQLQEDKAINFKTVGSTIEVRRLKKKDGGSFIPSPPETICAEYEIPRQENGGFYHPAARQHARFATGSKKAKEALQKKKWKSFLERSNLEDEDERQELYAWMVFCKKANDPLHAINTLKKSVRMEDDIAAAIVRMWRKSLESKIQQKQASKPETLPETVEMTDSIRQRAADYSKRLERIRGNK